MTTSYESLSGLFPLTHPIPTFVSHPHLLTPEHLSTEHELLRNPTSLPRWQSYISQVLEQIQQTLLTSNRGDQLSSINPLERLLLGERLCTKEGRESLQKITDVFERALQHHPTSFTLWRDYLKWRSLFVLGTPSQKLKLGAPRKNRGEEGGIGGRTMTEYLNAGKGEIEPLEDGEIDPE